MSLCLRIFVYRNFPIWHMPASLDTTPSFYVSFGISMIGQQQDVAFRSRIATAWQVSRSRKLYSGCSCLETQLHSLQSTFRKRSKHSTTALGLVEAMDALSNVRPKYLYVKTYGRQTKSTSEPFCSCFWISRRETDLDKRGSSSIGELGKCN